jgi:CRISPR-associated endonuclease/helicase Cas3
VADAHSKNDAGERHDLVAHLKAVAETARGFATGLNAEELAYYAGLWHDVGKFHPDFQNYLLRCEANPRARGHGPDHKAAGAELAMQHVKPLSLLIQGHHGGLRSPTDRDGWLEGERLKRGSAIASAMALARAAMPGLGPASPLTPPDFVLKDPLAAEMYLRLVFSALVDADFLDTERHFKAAQAIARGSSIKPADLWPLLEASQDELIRDAAASVVNDVRNAVYRHCLDAAEGERGFYKLTVPTGGGKTRAGMAFALRHAMKHRLDRVIVAAPLISITEQTASVYRGLFSAAGEHVLLEHHSMAEWDEGDDGDFHSGPVWDRLAAENWDAPIIVTTTVQIFESLFSNRTSRTRKLHRLAHSVIILDEAQALPPRLLKPILNALRQLVEHYGTTVVISTATQPAFEAIAEFAAVAPVEIVPDPARFFDTLRRVDYEWRTETPLPAAEAAAILLGQPQALAVLNTKKDALAVLDALDASRRATEAMPAGSWDEDIAAVLRGAEALHLSTLLCGAHRRDVLAEIKRRLDTGESCRLVSTQVIEAGVDLDFPFVMRALAPLDSIIQAAGRCNREGKLPEHGRVVIFEPEGGTLPQGSYRTGTDETRVLIRGRDLDPNTPEAARLYFNRLFRSVDTDAERIQAKRSHLNYPTVARDFQMIDDETYSLVITTYGDAAERQHLNAVLDELRRGTPRARELRRELQPHVVGLRTQQVQRLPSGLIEELRPGYGIWLGGYDAVRGIVLADMEPDALVF